MVAKYQREINPTKKYDALIPRAKYTQDIVNKDGNVKDTVGQMKEIIINTHWQAKKIAEMLAAQTGYHQNKDLPKLLQAVWEFVYNHFQYAKDQDGLEQLRSFQRSWKDRFTGIDCDCMSITIGSILYNLRIPFFLRVTKYTGDWQHVYVAVYDSKNSVKIIMDCVLDEFNKEEPFGDKFDTLINPLNTMNGLGMPIAFLNGIDEINAPEELEIGNAQDDLMGILCGRDFDDMEGLAGTETDQLSGNDKFRHKKGLYNHLLKTRQYIAKYPASVMSLPGGALAQLSMIDHALKHWGTKNHHLAIDDLVKEEERINGLCEINGVAGLHGLGDSSFDGADDDLGDLGKRKREKGKFWKKIKEAGKKVFKGIQKFNPLMVAARNGFLLAAKLNFFNIAKKLFPGFMTESGATSAGISKALWERKVKAAKQFADKWENLLGGKTQKLIQALAKGWQKRKKGGFKPRIRPATKTTVAGLGELYQCDGRVAFYGNDPELQGLGEPTSVIIGSSIAAAATLIATLAAVLKKNNAGDGDEESTSDKVADVANAAGDAAQNVTANMEGVDPELDGFDEYDGVTGYETDAELGELGRKSRAERRAARKAKRATNKAKRNAKKSKRNAEKGENGESGSEVLDTTEALLPAATGMVSAAKQLYKAKTGSDLEDKSLEDFATNPEKGLSPEAQKLFEENDKKMKSTMGDGFFGKLMNWVGENKAIAAIGGATLVGGGLYAAGAFDKKKGGNYEQSPRQIAPTQPALSGGHKKSKNGSVAKVLTLS